MWKYNKKWKYRKIIKQSLGYITLCWPYWFRILGNMLYIPLCSKPMLNSIRWLHNNIHFLNTISEDKWCIQFGLHWKPHIKTCHKSFRHIGLLKLWILKYILYIILCCWLQYNSKELLGKWHWHRDSTQRNSRYRLFIKCDTGSLRQLYWWQGE